MSKTGSTGKIEAWMTENIPGADSADNDHSSDVVGNKTDTIAGDSLVALLKQLLTTSPKIVERGAAVLPASTQTPYFTVTGKVLITEIVGEVTTVFDGTANSIKLVSDPTVGADVDLCSALVVTTDAEGSLYNITGTLSDSLVVETSGAVIAQVTPVIVAAGSIDLDATATDTTGSTKWVIHYIPLTSDGAIVAA